MHPIQRPAVRQQQLIQQQAANTDSYAFFNLLTGPQLLDGIESLLPDHRSKGARGLKGPGSDLI